MEVSLTVQSSKTLAQPPQLPAFALAQAMPVLVCRDGGAWVPGQLEAWRWDLEGWSALVRYTEADLEELDLEWVPEYSVWCQDGKPAYPPDAAVSVAWSKHAGAE